MDRLTKIEKADADMPSNSAAKNKGILLTSQTDMYLDCSNLTCFVVGDNVRSKGDSRSDGSKLEFTHELRGSHLETSIPLVRILACTIATVVSHMNFSLLQ
jgi:hypothetical protein